MRKLIAFAGKMGSGKTTIVDELIKIIDAEKISIAGILKEQIIENKITPDGILDKSRDRNILQDYGQLRRGELKEFLFSKGKVVNIDGQAWILRSDPYEEKFLGNCYENYWVDLAINKIESVTQKNIFVDDLRRINEGKALKKTGFVLINVVCPEDIRQQRLLEKYGKVEDKLLNNISETDIDNIDFDYTLNNDKNLDSIVKEILNLI
jgi:dephospho-CoA kinase